MKVSDMFPSRWLAAEDLRGKEVPVTIREVKPEKMRDPHTGEQIEKYVVYFEGKTKGLILNVTNARAIAEIVGTEETDKWPGREIVIYPKQIKVGGEVVGCVRVKPLQSERGG